MSGPVVALALLAGLAIPMVNGHRTSLSERAQSTNKHIFKTYWIHAAGNFKQAMELWYPVAELQAERYTTTCAELAPYALPGKDIEYARFLHETGNVYAEWLEDFPAAINYYLQAQAYAPQMPRNDLALVDAHYALQQYEVAFQYSLQLLEAGHPDLRTACRIVIDCGLRTGNRQRVRPYVERYVQRWPGDDVEQLLQSWNAPAPTPPSEPTPPQ